MQFRQSAIEDVFEVIAEPHGDERGAFVRIYCPQEFAAAGIEFSSTQINLSTNTAKHTLRGLHFQPAPFSEAKLVRCVSGKAFDVVVDLRKDSSSFGKWKSFELSADDMNGVFIPEGCAHGFLTLEDNTTIQYQMGRPYEWGHANGICWDDKTLAIKWPSSPKVLSDADKDWPKFSEIFSD